MSFAKQWCNSKRRNKLNTYVVSGVEESKTNVDGQYVTATTDPRILRLAAVETRSVVQRQLGHIPAQIGGKKEGEEDREEYEREAQMPQTQRQREGEKHSSPWKDMEGDEENQKTGNVVGSNVGQKIHHKKEKNLEEAKLPKHVGGILVKFILVF